MGPKDEGAKELWELETPARGLLAIGALLFIYESGMRIGLGRIVSQNDDLMRVEIEFTSRPRLLKDDGSHFLTYGLVSEDTLIGDGDGQ